MKIKISVDTTRIIEDDKLEDLKDKYNQLGKYIIKMEKLESESVVEQAHKADKEEQEDEEN